MSPLPPLPVPKDPVRFSHLKAYVRSALHGHHARTATEDGPTYAMERGTVVHALVFGNRKVCGYPGKTRQGKNFEAFVLEHPETEILTMAEFDKARRMADAVQKHKLAMSVLGGVREETLLFNWNGMRCRSTPDVRGPNYVTELKSAPDANPERFPWHSRRMGYHAQMAFEAIAFGRTQRRAPEDCFVVVVEHAAPHAVQVYRMEERAIEAGEKLLMLGAELLKTCEASGIYPPYTTVIAPLDLPGEDDDVELVFPDDSRVDQLQVEHGLQP